MFSSNRKGRREFLRKAAMLGVAGLPGCGLLRRQPIALCPSDPRYAGAAQELTIDVHAHVFNATDIQVERFIDLVALKQKGPLAEAGKALAGLLQDVGWDAAPNAEDELSMLRKLEPVLSKCEAGGTNLALDGLRDAAYVKARTSLNAALDRTGRAVPLVPGRDYEAQVRSERSLASPTAQADFLIRHLPDTRSEYFAQSRSRAQIRRFEPTIQGAIDFVIQNFQYRYVTVHDYLETFSRGPGRRIDLVVAHMVDYDWWLAKGAPTRSALRDQVAVMEQIALLTGGRVHAFAPFDPFREVVAKVQGGESSLALVKDSVRVRGCLGVKLYPPMGFAPLGNASLDVWKDRAWLPEIVRRPDFGKLLDDAMREFFGWARDEQVPIMAHTNVSNGPVRRFEELATAPYWKLALEEFDRGGRNLRVNFGHFGNTDLSEGGVDHSEAFVDLMGSGAGSVGAKAYADASYFSDVLNAAEDLDRIMKDLYLRGNGVLAKRLMYGTDWEMSLPQKNITNYLRGFERLYAVLGKELMSGGPQWRTLTDDFFALNAVEFLGLRKGEATRARLDAFYEGRLVPGWIGKVDRLS